MIVPTLQQLETDIRQDLEQALGITSVFQRRAINAFAAVQAGKLKAFYLAIGKLQKNIFVDTADPEAAGGTLERYGRVKLERNPFPATNGTYMITVTGQAGGIVAQGLTFRNPINNEVYEVTTTMTLTGTTASVQIISLNPGRGAILTVGDTVTATAPIVNVQSDATVASVQIEPQNAEDIEVYRQLVLQAFRTEPQGGSAADYRIWAADAEGVVRIYPFVGSQAGIINIYVEANTANRVPTQQILNDVQSVVEFDPDETKPLNERGRKPLSAWQINYLPITPVDIDVTISGLNDSSPAVINTIRTSIETYLEGIRPFVSGADDPNAVNDTLRISELIRIVQQAIGVNNFFNSLTMQVNNSQVNSFRFVNDDIPNLDNVTAS